MDLHSPSKCDRKKPMIEGQQRKMNDLGLGYDGGLLLAGSEFVMDQGSYEGDQDDDCKPEDYNWRGLPIVVKPISQGSIQHHEDDTKAAGDSGHK